MQLPIGMLIYWIAKTDDTKGMMMGLWYYKENWVPSGIEEKKQSLKDLKQHRCAALTIFGSFSQLTDILSQGDYFHKDLDESVDQFSSLLESIESNPANVPYKFDDVYNLKGTSLMVDMIIEVDESMETIVQLINSKKGVVVNIAESWNLYNDMFFIK